MNSLQNIDPSMIKHLIRMEELNLQVQKILGNKDECLRIRHKIADLHILRLQLEGYL